MVAYDVAGGAWWCSEWPSYCSSWNTGKAMDACANTATAKNTCEIRNLVVYRIGLCTHIRRMAIFDERFEKTVSRDPDQNFLSSRYERYETLLDLTVWKLFERFQQIWKYTSIYVLRIKMRFRAKAKNLAHDPYERETSKLLRAKTYRFESEWSKFSNPTRIILTKCLEPTIVVGSYRVNWEVADNARNAQQVCCVFVLCRRKVKFWRRHNVGRLFLYRIQASPAKTLSAVCKAHRPRTVTSLRLIHLLRMHDRPERVRRRCVFLRLFTRRWLELEPRRRLLVT